MKSAHLPKDVISQNENNSASDGNNVHVLKKIRSKSAPETENESEKEVETESGQVKVFFYFFWGAL